MIGSFASCATASLLAKNGTKNHLRCLKTYFDVQGCLNDHIKVPNIIGSFASCATASLVAKNGTKELHQLFEVVPLPPWW